jgi:hypothetical protein
MIPHVEFQQGSHVIILFLSFAIITIMKLRHITFFEPYEAIIDGKLTLVKNQVPAPTVDYTRVRKRHASPETTTSSKARRTTTPPPLDDISDSMDITVDQPPEDSMNEPPADNENKSKSGKVGLF